MPVRIRIVGLLGLAGCLAGTEPAGLSLDPEALDLPVGQSVTFRVLTSGGEVPGTVRWISENPLVADVSGDGVVTAHTPGTAEIRAEAGGMVGRAPVTTWTPLTGRWYFSAPRSGALPLFEFHLQQAENGSITGSGRSYNHTTGLYRLDGGSGAVRYPDVVVSFVAHGQEGQGTGLLSVRGRFRTDDAIEAEVNGPGYSGTIMLVREGGDPVSQPRR